MVLTTKHHEGFSMFKSQLTPYNIVDATPFKRDVTKELADACRDSGMRFGRYYSIDRDWYRPQGGKTPEANPAARVDVRFTAKGDSVYAICMAWPEKELELVLKVLGK